MWQAEYGVAFTFRAPMVKAGSDDVAGSGDWTPAAGDVMISKDGGAFTNIAALPTALGTTMWVWALTAAEMEAEELIVRVIDAATKAVKDQTFLVRTRPHGSIGVCKLAGGSGTTATFPNVAPFNAFGADNILNGAVFVAHGGTGRGQSVAILSFVNATRVATFDRTLVTPFDATTVGVLYFAPPAPTNPSAYLPVNVKAIDDGTTEATNVKTAFASTLAEAAAVPAANAPWWTKLNFLFAKARNRSTFNKDTGAWALRNDADSANIATRTDTNDGTTYTKAKDT